ncbi:uncharacterized protein JCM6883_005847 [Sporobolomyces salmoneus]|uniref:uncharacterized protein n=1 Tax=Sporobolomyces salmoneus TaxID=183962 RepID=UPI0031758698
MLSHRTALLSAASLVSTTLVLSVSAANTSPSSSISPSPRPHAHSASNAARITTTTTTPQAVAAPSTPASAAPAVDRTTEEGEAQILDPNQECTPYSVPAVTEMLPSYPDIWVTADLSNAGISDYDRSLFNALNATIPDIAPRGTRAGDFTGVTYDGATDADCWWTYSRCTTPKLEGLNEDVTKCDEPNTWGFTLDDGPNCSHNAYYDYLESIKQKATLFYIGSNVLDWPEEAARGLADGHEICSHTWSHPYMTAMTNEQAFAELYFSKKAIKDVLGITVRCWRPPYGDVDDRIRYIAQALDMETIIWTDDTFDYDWVTLGKPAIRANYDAILAKQANGTYNDEGIIVLTHEIDGGTMELSQEYLPKMQAAFSGGVVPVGTCRNISEPYVETSDFVYPNYAQYMAGTRSISLAAPTANPTNGAELVLNPSAASASATSSADPGQASRLAQSRAAGISSATQSGDNASATGEKKTGGAIRLGAGGVLSGVFAATLLGAGLVV